MIKTLNYNINIDFTLFNLRPMIKLYRQNISLFFILVDMNTHTEIR